ncbi:MAG: T9SS type A sorting domain-containing protein, partial [Bacteroidota bacterium]
FATTTDTMFIDTSPPPGDVSYYVLRAQDIHDNLSPKSNEVAITLTGIVARGAEMPTEYALHQNDPNPFNPFTTIQFDLSRPGKVTLTVFGTMGEEVETLVNQELSAGRYRVTWPATNVASGVYFYRLQAGEFVETKKMIILR